MTMPLPPKSVPGPFHGTVPPPIPPPVSQPHIRVVTVPINTTFHGLAMRYYNNPGEAVRLWAHNRATIASQNAIIPAGTRIVLP